LPGNVGISSTELQRLATISRQTGHAHCTAHVSNVIIVIFIMATATAVQPVQLGQRAVSSCSHSYHLLSPTHRPTIRMDARKFTQDGSG